MGVNSLPKTVTRQRRGCDLNPLWPVPSFLLVTPCCQVVFARRWTNVSVEQVQPNVHVRESTRVSRVHAAAESSIVQPEVRFTVSTQIPSVRPSVQAEVLAGQSMEVPTVQPSVQAEVFAGQSVEVPTVQPSVQADVHANEFGEIASTEPSVEAEVDVVECAAVGADDAAEHCLCYTSDEAFHGGGCLRVSTTPDAGRRVTKSVTLTPAQYTASLFHSTLKTFPLRKSFPPQPPFSSSRLTPRIPGLFTEVLDEHILFYFFSFSSFPLFSFWLRAVD